LKSPDQDILAPLSDRLKVLVKGLMKSNIENFIAPKLWAKYRELLLTQLGPDDERLMVILTTIDRRNARLNTSGTEKKASPRRQLIQLLDTTLWQALSSELVRDCWKLDEDKAMLIRTVLEWSTSSHRPGNVKIYVAARILRSWSKSGADITEAILSFLDTTACEAGRSRPAFYHLISELVRSEHFSVPRYLQWVIARGGLYNPADVAPDGPCATRLLAELPTHNLSESILELRMTLLNRADFLVDEEEDRSREYMVLMNRKLPGMQANVDMDLESTNVPLTANLTDLTSEVSRTTKSELGLWLRQKVGLQMVQPTIPPLDDWDDSPMKGGTSAITSSDFNSVRQYLERIDDFSMLADVLKIVSSSNDAEVLASCADTLNLHFETFAAIGALKGLFDILMGRLRALGEEMESIPRVFLVSLSDLASRLPEQKTVAQQLAQELARSDRKTAAEACSPVSDHMALMQTAEADFTDEIEKVLASGNSMDQATLERLFQRIILRLEASWEKSPEQQRSFGLLLTRLRTFDAPQFDLLMATWVNRLLQMQSRPEMAQVFGPLVSFGCLSLRDVLLGSISVEEKEVPSDDPKIPTISQEALGLLVAPINLPEVVTVEEEYRFRVEQAHMQRDYANEVLTVIRRAFEVIHQHFESDHETAFEMKPIFQSQGMYELLQRLLLLDTNSFTENLVMPLLQSTNSEIVAAINQNIDRLLSTMSSDETITAEEVLNLADDLTLPFCQVKLASMFRTEDTVMEGTEDSRSERLEAFDSAIGSAVTAGKTTWASIVPLLDMSISQHLRKRAETQFLQLFPSPRTASGDDSSSIQKRIILAENLLRIIDATAYSISATVPTVPNQASLAHDIVITLNGIWLLLSNSQNQEIKDAILGKWLPLLLPFTTIQASAFEPTKTGHESRAKATLSLAAIILELQALNISSEQINSLIETTFDLALHLVDCLPEDMRLQCVKSLRDAASSPKISYLFSVPTNPTEWLFLSQKERVGGGPGGAGGEGRIAGAGADTQKEKLAPFALRRWEMLGEPTPNVGENDTSLSLTLFGARKG
jgi:mediator of RNA polymerase II transcription subunit 12